VVGRSFDDEQARKRGDSAKTHTKLYSLKAVRVDERVLSTRLAHLSRRELVVQAAISDDGSSCAALVSSGESSMLTLKLLRGEGRMSTLGKFTLLHDTQLDRSVTPHVCFVDGRNDRVLCVSEQESSDYEWASIELRVFLVDQPTTASEGGNWRSMEFRSSVERLDRNAMNPFNHNGGCVRTGPACRSFVISTHFEWFFSYVCISWSTVHDAWTTPIEYRVPLDRGLHDVVVLRDGCTEGSAPVVMALGRRSLGLYQLNFQSRQEASEELLQGAHETSKLMFRLKKTPDMIYPNSPWRLLCSPCGGLLVVVMGGGAVIHTLRIHLQMEAETDSEVQTVPAAVATVSYHGREQFATACFVDSRLLWTQHGLVMEHETQAHFLRVGAHECIAKRLGRWLAD